MESSLSFAIPVHIIVNGKLYSPRFAICNGGDASDTLRFKISFEPDLIPSQQSVKLKIEAPGPRKNKGLLSRNQDYEANLFFPATGLIDYAYETPSRFSDIDRGFYIPSKQDIENFRCLNFSAKEVVIDMAPAPNFRTEQMEVDFARLINSAKSVVDIPEAVLDICCLIPKADDTTDSDMRTMECRLFAPPPSSPTLLPSSSGTDAITTEKPTKYLTMDSLMSRYKNKNQSDNEGSDLISPTSTLFGDSPNSAKMPNSRRKTSPPVKNNKEYSQKQVGPQSRSPKQKYIPEKQPADASWSG
jgi:hypothetical protein